MNPEPISPIFKELAISTFFLNQPAMSFPMKWYAFSAYNFGAALAGSCSASTTTQPRYPEARINSPIAEKSMSPSPGTVNIPSLTADLNDQSFLLACSITSQLHSLSWLCTTLD